MDSFLKTVAEQLHSTASVKAVFGEPIYANDKVIIPVARVAYGFGGGGGTNRNNPTEVQSESRELSDRGVGGGAGGGISVIPIGVVEISGGRTRFILIRNNRLKLVGTFLAGVAVTLMLSHKKPSPDSQN